MNAFAEFQPQENKLLPGVLESAGVDWLLEMAPATSPSPALGVPRHRMLLDSRGWCWPVEAPGDRLPFAEASLPACLMRYLLQPGVPDELFAEVMRCLRPGGLLVIVNPNPWHPGAWRGIGKSALWLPSWPALQLMAIRHGLVLQHTRAGGWRAWTPGTQSLLVLVARKSGGGQVVRPMKFRQPAIGRQTAATGHLRKSA